MSDLLISALLARGKWVSAMWEVSLLVQLSWKAARTTITSQMFPAAMHEKKVSQMQLFAGKSTKFIATAKVNETQ